MTTDTMTTAEYARHRGVSDSYIRRKARAGDVVRDGEGRILVRASDALLNATTNPVRGGKRVAGQSVADAPDEPEAGQGAPTRYTVPPSETVTVQEAVRRERLARARLAELELGEETKQLTRVGEVHRAVFTLVRAALNDLHGMPSRLAKQLAAETDTHRVAELLSKDVQRLAADMRRAAESLRGDGAAPADDTDQAEGDDEAEAQPA